MAKTTKANEFVKISPLSEAEKLKVNSQVELELHHTQCKMIKIGGITNIVTGIYIIWILFQHVELSILIGWYTALVLINTINMGVVYYYQNRGVSSNEFSQWRRTYHSILAILCLIWGSIGVLFPYIDVPHKLFIFTFLQIVLVGFMFGTITDFTASVISGICLLLPFITIQTITAIKPIFSIFGFKAYLNIIFAISLLVLGAFLLITSYVGYYLIKRFFTLSFTNSILNKKLGNMNKLLEQRVKERTIELEKAFNLVTHQSTHDSLTDLPNRRLLLDYIRSAIKLANKKKHMFAVVIFSLNEIERIIDALGYQIGDLVIYTVAQRLRKICGEKESEKNLPHCTVTISRRDEFVILLEPVYKPEEVKEKVDILFSILDDLIHTKAQAIKLTASVGVSIYPKDGRNIKSLLINADAAMLRSKELGGNNMHIYQVEIKTDTSKELALESDLHSAVKNKEFILKYQPLFDLKENKICGMEALVYWKHPSMGILSPGEFIYIAESNGLIVPIGEWVLKTACSQIKAWHLQGFNKLKISVNLSARQLQDKKILQYVVTTLKKANLKPQFLELELTETDAFKKETVPIIKQFKSIGLGLSIDDFGTGYSGLTNLKLFSIDKLKIDKSFVEDIDHNLDSKIIVSNTIALAKKLNIDVVAEGVETKNQLEFLQRSGCDMIQGYYFSPPVDATVFTELLVTSQDSSNFDATAT